MNDEYLNHFWQITYIKREIFGMVMENRDRLAIQKFSYISGKCGRSITFDNLDSTNNSFLTVNVKT